MRTYPIPMLKTRYISSRPTLAPITLEQLADRANVDARRTEQGVLERLANLDRQRPPTRDPGDELADQGVAVGVDAAGRQPDDGVPGFDAPSVDDPMPFDHPDA